MTGSKISHPPVGAQDMTTPEQLEALAERVEKLSAPCRKTDWIIASSLGWKAKNLMIFDPDVMPRDTMPFFTSSLDAAMTLVPKNYYWHVGHGRTRDDEPLGGASIIEPSSLDSFAEAEAPTAPLALTAAALRAHAQPARGEVR